MNRIFLDFDGVIVDTIGTIVDLYNEDFKYYSDYKYIFPEQVNTWEFAECNCASKEYIDSYFNQQRFFDKLKFMPNAYENIRSLALNHKVIIVSCGYSPNLRAKEIWIKNNLPFCKFKGVNLKCFPDKSHIYMDGDVFVDDSSHNLITSNASIKICYGQIYPWNMFYGSNSYQDEKEIRCYDWDSLYDRILNEEYAMVVQERR